MKRIKNLKTRKDRKEYVQDQIMVGIGNVLGYWMEELSEEERDELGAEGLEELRTMMQQQADRVAKMFGYNKAWSN